VIFVIERSFLIECQSIVKSVLKKNLSSLYHQNKYKSRFAFKTGRYSGVEKELEKKLLPQIITSTRIQII